MNNINQFLNKLILQISLIWFDKANPKQSKYLQINLNLPATLLSHCYAGRNPKMKNKSGFPGNKETWWSNEDNYDAFSSGNARDPRIYGRKSVLLLKACFKLLYILWKLYLCLDKSLQICSLNPRLIK